MSHKHCASFYEDCASSQPDPGIYQGDWTGSPAQAICCLHAHSSRRTRRRSSHPSRLSYTRRKTAPSTQTFRAIAKAHHGKVTLFAHNLKTGQTASLAPDELVKTASVIKLAVLLDAAEQIRSGRATLDEKLTLTKENQVDGSGVLALLDTPLPLTSSATRSCSWSS